MDIDTTQAIYFLALAAVIIAAMIPITILEVRAELREWRRKKMIDKGMAAYFEIREELTTDALGLIADNFVKHHVSVSRYGDRRYRTGAFASLCGDSQVGPEG